MADFLFALDLLTVGARILRAREAWRGRGGHGLLYFLCEADAEGGEDRRAVLGHVFEPFDLGSVHDPQQRAQRRLRHPVDHALKRIGTVQSV